MPLNCVANTSRREGSQLLWISLTNKLLHSRAGLAAIILQEAGLDGDFAPPPLPPAFKFTLRHPSKLLDRKFLQRGAFVGARTVHTT